jgi:hypothetical protein
LKLPKWHLIVAQKVLWREPIGDPPGQEE